MVASAMPPNKRSAKCVGLGKSGSGSPWLVVVVVVACQSLVRVFGTEFRETFFGL